MASSSVDDALASFESLSLGAIVPENSLSLHQSVKGTIGTLKFDNHKLIGKFGITKDEKYSDEDSIIPSLISEDKIRKLHGTFLGSGYETAIKLEDYAPYHVLKQEYFFKWLVDNQYFVKVADKEYKKPDFIGFGGRITDPMQSPLKTRYGEWEIYAVKFLDTIFIWDEKIVDVHKHTKESFYGIAYEALLTGKDPAAVNELEETFVIQEVAFGSKQLLLVSEIDAVDEDDKWLELKIYRECSRKGMQAKFLRYWAQCIVPGVTKVVTGRRDDGGLLQETTTLSLNDVLQRASCNTMNVNRCFQFEDQLLSWIKSHFKENNPKFVKKFVWTGPPSKVVTCAEVPEAKLPKGMLPNWFVEAMAKDKSEQ